MYRRRRRRSPSPEPDSKLPPEPIVAAANDYDEIGEKENKKNHVYERPTLKPGDADKSQPYESLKSRSQQPAGGIESPIYYELTDIENQKNDTYEHPNFKPNDAANFHPYQRLNKTTMK